MGELEFRGLDNSLIASFVMPGNALGAKSTIRPISMNILLPRTNCSLPTWTGMWRPHVTANVRDKTVDVDMIYSVKAPK